MTPQETQRFNTMEKEISEINVKVDEVLEALKGNPTSGDIGLVARLAKNEDITRELQRKNDENKFLILVIKWLLGIVGSGVIGYFLVSLVHK